MPCRASGRSAKAHTTGLFPAMPPARGRAPRCRADGSAEAAPAPSSPRPTGRICRSPRRHIPSRSANAGSASRRAAKGCGDRPGSGRVPQAVGHGSRHRAGKGASLFRGCGAAALRFDLVDRGDHRIEGQHGGGMARLVIAHRLEHRDVGPFARRRRAVLLEHAAHGLAQLAQFLGAAADHVARHDRGGCLAERASLHLVGEIGDDVALHLQVGGDGRAAQLGVRARGRVRLLQPPEARNRGRKLQNAAIVDLVEHASRRNLTKGVICMMFRAEYIGMVRARRYASPGPTRCKAGARRGRVGTLPGALPGAGGTERMMDAILKSFPTPELSEHVRAAPKPVSPKPSRQEAEAAVKVLIAFAGDDPAREGLQDTPARVVSAYEELFRGYRECPLDVLDRTFSEIHRYDDLVLIRDVPFSSHCEHHMAPFVGKAHIAYIPVERVVGLSKLARLVDVYARRLQTQEHLTSQVTSAIDEILKPRGVAVMLEAEHLCISMRGVQKAGVSTVTTQFTGSFREPTEQVRFIPLVRGPAAA